MELPAMYGSVFVSECTSSYHFEIFAMKSIKVFYFFVTLLPMMVNSIQPIHYYSKQIKNISNKNCGRINGVFEPTEYIGSGKAGIVYKGKTFAEKN